MARQVGFTVHLTASLRSGTRALDELLSQERISTTTWHTLHAEAIVNEAPYSSVTRILRYTLEDKTRIQVKVMAWANDHERETEQQSERRKWFPCHVYVEKGPKMLAFENHVNQRAWARQPEYDKPLPGATWRVPRSDEIVAYKAAVFNRDEQGFLDVYYADLIAWQDVNAGLRRDTGWVHRTLRMAA